MVAEYGTPLVLVNLLSPSVKHLWHTIRTRKNVDRGMKSTGTCSLVDSLPLLIDRRLAGTNARLCRGRELPFVKHGGEHESWLDEAVPSTPVQGTPLAW